MHYDWLAWIDWTHLMEMLFIPVCILVASLTIGIMLNKLINRRIENHLNIDEDSWFYIFICPENPCYLFNLLVLCI